MKRSRARTAGSSGRFPPNALNDLWQSGCKAIFSHQECFNQRTSVL
jgi:hypothetical protein